MPRNPNIIANLSPLDQLQQRLGGTPIPSNVHKDTAFQSAQSLLAMEMQLVNDELTVGMIPVLESYAANLVGWRRTLSNDPSKGRPKKPWEKAGKKIVGSKNGQGQKDELDMHARQMVDDPIFCIDKINAILDRLPKSQ